MTGLAIYWKTSDAETVRKIRERFSLTRGTGINGETEAWIKDEDMPLLVETAKRGFIELRRKRIKYKPFKRERQ